MNFYKHHIGDYAQATSHLSFVEDAAYSRLLRKYYAEERPIPADLKVACRLVGARTKEEKEAVETVLEEFFKLDADENVWRNKRADEEIAKANAQAETNRRIAGEREARKRSQRSRETGTIRGDRGDDSSDGSSHDQSTKRQPSQTPDSRHQTPASVGKTEASTQISQRTGTEAGRACLLMRQAGCIRTNPSHPALLSALDEGVSPETLRDTAIEAVEAGVSMPFAWAIQTARSRHAEGSPPLTTTGPPAARRSVIAPSRTRTALEALQARKTTDELPTRLAEDRDPRRLVQAGDAEP